MSAKSNPVPLAERLANAGGPRPEERSKRRGPTTKAPAGKRITATIDLDTLGFLLSEAGAASPQEGRRISLDEWAGRVLRDYCLARRRRKRSANEVVAAAAPAEEGSDQG